jgi:uncharacterized membrane protein (DUF4010 family)
MESIFLNGAEIGQDIPMLWQKIAIAILIGLFIGVERERKKKEGSRSFAGIRTFPLISILGFLSALIASYTSMAVYAAFFVIFGILVSIAYYFSAKKGLVGATSDITELLIFLLGSLVFWGHLLLSAAIAVVIVTFLTMKSEFRAFAGRVEEEDLYATIKFALITIIILPLLPNQTFWMYDVLNPRKIWYFVVLISGISFVGYVLFKLTSARKGIQILSILGGLASSTALTLTFTNRSKETPELSRSFAAGIILGSTIMFPRIILIVAVLNAELALQLLIPFAVFTVAGIITSFSLWKLAKRTYLEDVNLENPFRVLFAVKFGIIFAAILFISAAANDYFGDQGVYLTSFIGGFANVDAVALSMVDMSSDGIVIKVAAIAIVIGSIANTILKTIISAFFGSKQLTKFVLSGFGVILFVMAVYLLFAFLI